MTNGVDVHGIIRRSNRNVLLLTLVALVGLVIGIVTAVPYWSQMLSPTKVLTTAEVINMSPDALPMYNVTISGNRMFGTFYEEYIEENGARTRTTAYFGTLRLDGDKFVVVRNPTDIDVDVTEYKGELTMPTSISLDAVDSLRTESPDLAPDVFPFVLDAAPDNSGWIAGAVAIAVLALCVVIGLFTFMTRSSNTSRHPIMKSLARFGSADDALSEINGELMTSEQKQSFPGLSFTRNWLVYAKGTTFEAARLNDIMWVYKQSVRNRYGTNHYTHIYDRYGRLLNIQGNEKAVNEMIGAVINRAPWAIGGYSDDIRKSWNSNRQSFIQTVDGRHQQQDTM